MSAERIEEEERVFANGVFLRFLAGEEARLLHGARLREEVHAAVERGEKPQGYRADWLRQEALHLVRVMEQVAMEFNVAHPDDKCSTADLQDVLITAHRLFSSGSGDE